MLTTETTTSATATAPSAIRPTPASGAGRVCHHRTTDHEIASHVSIPSAHVQITRYGKISPTMRDYRHEARDDRQADHDVEPERVLRRVAR